MLDSKQMDENEFWSSYELTRSEVKTAIESFYTWLEIYNLAASDKGVYRWLNKNPAFWNINLYGLQSSFFIVLGRVFDDGKDAHSIHKFMALCLTYSHFFSKDALAVRKQDGAAKKPDWLDEYMEKAYEPSKEDFIVLKKALSSHRKKFDDIYKDIRHYVFAHKIAKEPEAVSELFGKTKIAHIEEMLYFLYDFLEIIWQLFHNGRMLQLGKSKYDYKERISNSVESVLGEMKHQSHMA